MTGFNHAFILKQALALAYNMDKDAAGKTGLSAQKTRDLERLAAVVVPGMVAFLGRMSAALPGDEIRLQPVIENFFTATATAAGVFRLSGGDQGAMDDLAEQFVMAAGGEPPVSRSDFEDALVEMAAAMREAVRQGVDRTGVRKWIAGLYQQVCPVFLNDDYTSLHSAAGYLIEALKTAGLSEIRDGSAIAADGVTVIFIWHGQAAEAHLEETAGEGPPESANGGAGHEPPLPPQPPMPEPSEKPIRLVALRLDAALPERVTVGQEFILAVSIRQPGSPVLAPDDLERRESADFAALWPENAPFIALRIQVKATGAEVLGGGIEPVRLLAGQDSSPVYFQITPRQTGPINVIITVYQEADWIGSTRVVTDAAIEARGELTIAINSRPVGDDDANLKILRQVLDDGYNLEELRDLCFELGIDYEDLPSETQSGKARELVLYARRHGLEAKLVERVMADRPHLLVPA
jgi:hypothetical protein